MIQPEMETGDLQSPAMLQKGMSSGVTLPCPSSLTFEQARSKLSLPRPLLVIFRRTGGPGSPREGKQAISPSACACFRQHS
jgi:hypothetical protein